MRGNSMTSKEIMMESIRVNLCAFIPGPPYNSNVVGVYRRAYVERTSSFRSKSDNFVPPALW